MPPSQSGFGRRDARREPERQPALSQSAVSRKQRGPSPQEPAVDQPLNARGIGIYEAGDLERLDRPQTALEVEERRRDRSAGWRCPPLRLAMVLTASSSGSVWTGLAASTASESARQAPMLSGSSLNQRAASTSWSIASKGTSTLSSSSVHGGSSIQLGLAVDITSEWDSGPVSHHGEPRGLPTWAVPPVRDRVQTRAPRPCLRSARGLSAA